MKELNSVETLTHKIFLSNIEVQFPSIIQSNMRMENAIPLIEELRKLHRYLKQEITDAINRIQTVAANLAYRV